MSPASIWPTTSSIRKMWIAESDGCPDHDTQADPPIPRKPTENIDASPFLPSLLRDFLNSDTPVGVSVVVDDIVGTELLADLGFFGRAAGGDDGAVEVLGDLDLYEQRHNDKIDQQKMRKEETNGASSPLLRRDKLTAADPTPPAAALINTHSPSRMFPRSTSPCQAVK